MSPRQARRERREAERKARKAELRRMKAARETPAEILEQNADRKGGVLAAAPPPEFSEAKPAGFVSQNTPAGPPNPPPGLAEAA